MTLEKEKNKMSKLAGLSGDKNLSIMEIIEKFDYLKVVFKYIVNNNTSNDAPYHNLNHLMTVTRAVYEGMNAEGLGDESLMKEMLIAAFFHDFKHSAGKLSDDKNIENAKKGLKKFLEEENIDADFEFMENIIDATQYPYVIEEADLNEYQKIIRDADLMQVIQYNSVHQCIHGLSEELGIPFEKFIESQKKFIDGAKFNTKWGNKIKQDNWKRVEKEVEVLLGIFKK